MDNSIELENPEDIANEKAAVAMLLAAAKEAAAAEASAAAPEPVSVGDIDNLQDLFDQQKALGNQLQVLKNQEAELILQLQSIREEAAAIERQGTVLKEKAARLFETVFGKSERETPRETPRPVSLQIVKPAEVSHALPEDAPVEAHQASRIPSLQL